MGIRRMDHVGVVVDDFAAALEFFGALGLEPKGDGTVEGELVDRIVGLEGVRSRFAMLETPDGKGRIELIAFDSPPLHDGDPTAPANTPGLRHLAFEVDDIDAALATARAHGAEMVGEVVSYGNAYRFCYLRGPAGIIVELAEPIG